MSKITIDGWTGSGTECFIAYPYGNSGRQTVQAWTDASFLNVLIFYNFNCQTCISTRAIRATTVILCLSRLLLTIHVAPGLPRVWSNLRQNNTKHRLEEHVRLQWIQVAVSFHHSACHS